MIWVLVFVAAYFLAVSSGGSRVQGPQPEKGTVPTVKDGKRVIRVYGTVWIDDPMQLAMQQMGSDPIQRKGGKK